MFKKRKEGKYKVILAVVGVISVIGGAILGILKLKKCNKAEGACEECCCEGEECGCEEDCCCGDEDITEEFDSIAEIEEIK